MNNIYEKLKALSDFVDTEMEDRRTSIDKQFKYNQFVDAHIELAAYVEAKGIKEAMKRLDLYIGED